MPIQGTSLPCDHLNLLPLDTAIAPSLWPGELRYNIFVLRVRQSASANPIGAAHLDRIFHLKDAISILVVAYLSSSLPVLVGKLRRNSSRSATSPISSMP